MSTFAPFTEFTTPSHALPAEATSYMAKLKRSGRSWALVSAFVSLLFAALRQDKHLSALCLGLASAIGAYVAEQLGTKAPDSRALARTLEQRIHDYTAKAVADLQPLDVPARIALIIVSETQIATADAFRAAAGVLTVIRRETTSPNPCDRCEQLARDYEHPIPEECWETHPRCACTWARITQ